MGAIAATKKYGGEFSGQVRLLTVQVVPASASDTSDLSTLGISSIEAVVASPVVEGQDANLLTAHVTFSGTTITVATLGADGLAASDWTGAKVNVTLLVK